MVSSTPYSGGKALAMILVFSLLAATAVDALFLGLRYGRMSDGILEIAVTTVVLFVVLAVPYGILRKSNLTVTNRRIYGAAAWGRRVDLPLSAVSAVGPGRLHGIAVTTSTGTIRFPLMGNRDEIQEVLHRLLTGQPDAAAGDDPPVCAEVRETLLQAVRTAVCAQLKSPASAQFPESLLTVTGDETRGYHVEGYVDAQNSYGAMIRNDFTADVTMENGVPVVRSASVAVKTSRARAKAFGVNYLALLILVAVGGVLLYMILSVAVGL